MPAAEQVQPTRTREKTGQELVVFSVSGYTRNAIVHAGHAGGGIDLIEKPFSATHLARRVRQALDAGRTREAS